MVTVPEDLKRDMVRTSQLVPYMGNAKKHPEWQVEEIANSIQAFGFNDPIAIWEDIAGHWVIVEGHGRLLAAKRLGMEEVPVIRLDHLDDEARRAYTLVHNKLTMNTDFDSQILDTELDAIEGYDMAEFGFEEAELGGFGPEADVEKYSQKITTPIYEVRGEEPDPSELCDTGRYDALVGRIMEAELDPDVRAFLLLAASRHIVFDYGKIAEFYAHQGPEVQRLMEDSTLVIVDFGKAVEMGCVKAAVELNLLREGDEDE